MIEWSFWSDMIKPLLPGWASRPFFFLSVGQWCGLFMVFLGSFLGEKVVRGRVAHLFTVMLARVKIIFTTEQQDKLSLPFGLISFSLLFMGGIFLLDLPVDFYHTLYRISVVLLTLGCVVASLHSVDTMGLYFREVAAKSDNKFDDILVPLVVKTLKVFVFLLGIIFILKSFQLDVGHLLAGLGIGGLAFALAAKDTISNLFGSLTVIFDRPFHIGDWVVIPEKNIEGTVEEVGFRSTRIRTFYDSLITVPNSLLTNTSVDNFGQRSYRRYSTKISIQYDTPVRKIDAFCEEIRLLILNHPHTRKDYFHVYLNELGSSGLQVMLYVFWLVPDWGAELKERERLLKDILSLGKNLGVEFAFPTQTLHLFNKEVDSKIKLRSLASDLELNED